MKVELQCSIFTILDAIGQGSTNVAEAIFDKARETINNGGTVCIYEEYKEPFLHRENLFFNTIDGFNKWVEVKFPNL